MSVASVLNTMSEDEARAALTNCCAATAWVDAMLARRLFAEDAAVFAATAMIADELNEADWLEAFAAHPLIGDVASLRAKFAATRPLAANEQSGVAAADDETLRELAKLNPEYRERFGFIFIVCAAGKAADEMLALLKTRISNTRDEEIANAAAEQLKITQLRLQRLASRAGDA